MNINAITSFLWVLCAAGLVFNIVMFSAVYVNKPFKESETISITDRNLKVLASICKNNTLGFRVSGREGKFTVLMFAYNDEGPINLCKD